MTLAPSIEFLMEQNLSSTREEDGLAWFRGRVPAGSEDVIWGVFDLELRGNEVMMKVMRDNLDICGHVVRRDECGFWKRKWWR